MPSSSKRLSQEAISAMNSAYAPYSKYRVGCAILGDDGNIYTGCNIENASYGLTICAERVAVFNSVSKGVRKFRALCLATVYPSRPSMCGACRQVLSEFCDELDILYVDSKGHIWKKKLSKLLPEAFRL